MSSLISNFTTLVYILRTFNIGVHVFNLIFLDDLISIVCSSFLFIFDLLFLNGVITNSYLNCTLAFMGANLPCNLGALLTMLIAFIRYYLTVKSAKNIQISNKKVLGCSMALVFLVTIFNVVYFTLSAMQNIPIALYVDACAYPDQEPRELSAINTFILQSPNIYNIIAVIVVLQLVRFLKKIILPRNNDIGMYNFFNFCFILCL